MILYIMLGNVIMKILLIAILLIISNVCWLFGTSLTVNGENTRTAFIIKSVLYWVAVVLAYGVGLYVA